MQKGATRSRRCRAGIVHRHGGADGIQDRRGQDRSPGDRAAAHHSAHAGNRQPRGNRQRPEQLGADQHRDRDGCRDAERRSADAHADAHPQRAERRRVPARRQHHRHQPRLDDQRAAGRLPQHHARRRQQQRQLPAQHRRVLRLGHAAAGRGRSGVGHARRGRCAGRRRCRRRDDGVSDAVGRQPLHRQRLRVLPEPELQLELLLQRGESPGQERGEAEYVRRACRRADRDSRPLQRQGQGVLLRALRAGPLPEQLHADPHGVQPARRRRLVPLPVRHRGPRGQPAAAGGGQRADLGQGPDHDEPDGADRRVHQDHRHAQRQRRSALRLVRVAEPRDALRAPAHGPSRLQPHRQPPPERLVDADHRQADAGLPEQRRPEVPGRTEPARLRVHAAAAVDGPPLRPVEEPHLRAARRDDGLRGRLELRLSVRHRVAERSNHVRRRRAATPSPRPATPPTGTRRMVRPGEGRRPTASTRR